MLACSLGILWRCGILRGLLSAVLAEAPGKSVCCGLPQLHLQAARQPLNLALLADFGKSYDALRKTPGQNPPDRMLWSMQPHADGVGEKAKGPDVPWTSGILRPPIENAAEVGPDTLSLHLARS